MVKGDGHDRFTPAHTYFSCIRELYVRRYSIMDRECVAMEAQANLMDGRDDLEKAERDSDRLRAKAKIRRAESILSGSLIAIRDLKKEMSKLHEIMLRHEPLVEKLYGCDIERAQEDIYKSIYTAKLISGEPIRGIPLPSDQKALLGAQYDRPEAGVQWLVERQFIKEKGLSIGPDKLKLGDVGRRNTSTPEKES